VAIDIRTSDITSAIAYASSGAVAVSGSILTALNNNAPAFGVLLGAATFLINWHYQKKRALTSELNRKNIAQKMIFCPRECNDLECKGDDNE